MTPSAPYVPYLYSFRTHENAPTPEGESSVVRLLGDDAYRARMLSEYGEIRKALGTAGASRAVAAAMIAALKP